MKAASEGDAKSAYASILPSYEDMHNGAHSISALIARIFSGRILATMVPTFQGLRPGWTKLAILHLALMIPPCIPFSWAKSLDASPTRII
jgi:hypothetical protein